MNALAALSYFGLKDTTLSLEYMQSLVLNNPARDESSGVEVLGPVEQPMLAARVRRSFLRDQLTLTLVWLWIGAAPFIGVFVRGELEYELREAVHLGLGYRERSKPDLISRNSPAWERTLRMQLPSM